MSCWKCGKELPEGIVECEDGCVLDAGHAHAVSQELMKQAGQPIPADARALSLCIELFLDPKKIEADPAGQRKAVLKFSTMLGEILVNSGISEFLKTKK